MIVNDITMKFPVVTPPSIYQFGLSHNWVLYFLCAGRRVFPYLQYEAFLVSRKDSPKGRICYLCIHQPTQIQIICFSYSNKNASFSTLCIPCNIPYIMFLVSDWWYPHENDLIKIQSWYPYHYPCLPLNFSSTLL